MKKTLRILIFLLPVFLSSHAFGFASPIGVSIMPPLQFPPSDFMVTGVRVSALWGHHRDIYGFDFAAVGNITDQDFVGVGVSGIFNNLRGQSTILGLQAAGITNINSEKTSVYGLQVAGGVNYQSASSSVVGLQVALLANWAPNTNIYGLQVGLYNRALRCYGFQVGLVNMCDSLHGIQIGLLNIHHRGVVKMSPIINVGF